jgi:hypothetical protein
VIGEMTETFKIPEILEKIEIEEAQALVIKETTIQVGEADLLILVIVSASATEDDLVEEDGIDGDEMGLKIA